MVFALLFAVARWLPAADWSQASQWLPEHSEVGRALCIHKVGLKQLRLRRWLLAEGVMRRIDGGGEAKLTKL